MCDDGFSSVWISCMVSLAIIIVSTLFLLSRDDNRAVKGKPNYITMHHCVAENASVIDGVIKVRYLCNAEGDDAPAATD